MPDQIRHLYLVVWLLAPLLWGGCAGKAPVRKEPLPPPQELPPPSVQSHLEGIWENAGKNGKTKQMVFESDGTLRFAGGLEYFNPALWILDSGQHELKITFPDAEDEKLQIFQLYLKDGVKAFDRRGKQVTFAFDEQTWSLNVGGWIYSKADKATPDAGTLTEPTFK